MTVLGLLGTGIAFAFFYSLIRSVGPARTYVVTYIAPGFAVFYGALFLDERISATTVAGLALIVGGSWSPPVGSQPEKNPRPVDLPRRPSATMRRSSGAAR